MRCVTLERVIGSPLRLGNKADVGPRSGLSFSQWRTALTVDRHSGTVGGGAGEGERCGGDRGSVRESFGVAPPGHRAGGD